MSCCFPLPRPSFSSLQSRFLTRNYSAESLEAVKELDNLLCQLSVRSSLVAVSGFSVCVCVVVVYSCVSTHVHVEVCIHACLCVTFQSCVPVDLMPGSHDPTNFQLPQQPMHKCMFPKASQHKNLKGVTNPYSSRIGGRR